MKSEIQYPLLFGSRGIIAGRGLAAKIYLLLFLKPMKLVDLAKIIYPDSKNIQLAEITKVLGGVKNPKNKKDTLIGSGYVDVIQPDKVPTPNEIKENRMQGGNMQYERPDKRKQNPILKSNLLALFDYMEYILASNSCEHGLLDEIKFKKFRDGVNKIYDNLLKDIEELKNLEKSEEPNMSYETIVLDASGKEKFRFRPPFRITESEKKKLSFKIRMIDRKLRHSFAHVYSKHLESEHDDVLENHESSDFWSVKPESPDFILSTLFEIYTEDRNTIQEKRLIDFLKSSDTMNFILFLFKELTKKKTCKYLEGLDKQISYIHSLFETTNNYVFTAENIVKSALGTDL